MKLGFRETLFLVLLVGILAASYLRFRQTAQRRTELNADSLRMQSDLSSLNRAMASIDDLNNKIAEFQKAIHFFESKLPQQKEVDKILQDVWKMAEANALQTRTVKTLKPQRSANYSEQPIEMSLSGDFKGFYTFLQQLERLERITRISQMELQKISGREGEMQAKMTLSIFFEPDAANDDSVMATAR